MRLRLSILAGGVLSLLWVPSASANPPEASTNIVLACDTQTLYTIVHATNATDVEQTAVAELSNYLAQVTGAVFPVATDDTNVSHRIVVGPCSLAVSILGSNEVASLSDEELLIRTVATAEGTNVFLLGGGSNGTLYAVYSFLENEVGCRWLSMYGDATVPSSPLLEIPSELDRSETPAFRARSIYTYHQGDVALRDEFLRRNRAHGDSGVPPYAGVRPAVHTSFYYVNPTDVNNPGYGVTNFPATNNYFVTNPEYFSLISGVRVARQLCFTDPGLRQTLTAHVEDRIQQTGASGVYSISAMDVPGDLCQHSACAALVAQEGTPGAPLFDYLVELGNYLKTNYPNVFISTLAYRKNQTEKPPATIVLPDNVLVYFAPIDANMAAPLDHPSNADTLANLTAWTNKTQHLMVWYYTNPSIRSGALPIGNLGRLARDLQICRDIGVEGFFIEHAAGVHMSHHLTDLQTWLITKQLWDPSQDLDVLIQTFSTNFYGPAAPSMTNYVSALEAATEAMPTEMLWGPYPGELRYLTTSFLMSSQDLFDQAEALVAADPVLLLRVRQARMSLDRACAVYWDNLSADPLLDLDLVQIANRYNAAFDDTLDQRVLPARRATWEGYASDLLDARLALPAPQPVPAPLDTIFQPDNYVRRVFVMEGQEDALATRGLAATLDTSELPLSMGFYDQTDTIQYHGQIPAEDITTNSYDLYYINTAALNQRCLVWFTASWMLSIPISEHYDHDDPDRLWDVYASVRFEGPTYPFGGTGLVDRIYVDQIVLVAVPSYNNIDQDTLPDEWEETFFGSITNSSGGNDDQDGDGFSDLSEYVAGTDPTNRLSALRCLNIDSLTNTTIVINWSSVTGKTYAIEHSSNMIDGIWLDTESNIPAHLTGMNSYTTSISGAESLYFRIKLEY